MSTSFERKHKVIMSVCMLKTAAQVCVPKLAVSSSQYFYNLRASRVEDAKLVKLCVHILLLYNIPYCTMPHSIVKEPTLRNVFISGNIWEVHNMRVLVLQTLNEHENSPVFWVRSESICQHSAIPVLAKGSFCCVCVSLLLCKSLGSFQLAKFWKRSAGVLLQGDVP